MFHYLPFTIFKAAGLVDDVDLVDGVELNIDYSPSDRLTAFR